MKLERIEGLRARLQSKILHSLPMLTNTDYEDLLSLLDEKAEQIKAGATVENNGPGGREETTPSALKTKFGDAGSIPAPALSPSPGLSDADERALMTDEMALTFLGEAIQAARFGYGSLGKSAVARAAGDLQALAHLRFRLAKAEPPYIYEITEAGTVIAIGPRPPKEENNGQL